MAALLDEIEWSEPLLQPVSDPAWEAQIKRRGGQVSEADKRIAPSPWLREVGLAMVTYIPTQLPQRLFTLGALVTAQENSCRYCYGANRAYMKILGYSETFISRVERDMRVAELDEREHAAMAFCRNLARSRPRPAKAEKEALIRLGYSASQVNEMALMISMGCFYNRIGILMACPPEAGFERMANGLMGRILGLLAPLTIAMMNRQRRGGQPPLLSADELKSGPFGEIVATVAGLPGAAMMKFALDGAFESTILSRTAKALIFAVVARTLGCGPTERAATKMLAADGLSAAEIESALQTLQSSRLKANESRLLGWARDTVYYQTPEIQKKTRALAADIDQATLLEAIGTAALANATARLAMLLE
jgi:alkylhydroperoxidase family enzyme